MSARPLLILLTAALASGAQASAERDGLLALARRPADVGRSIDGTPRLGFHPRAQAGAGRKEDSMTRLKIVSLAAAAAFAASPALAEETKLSAHLGGAGSADTDGAGHATFKVDAAKNQICYDLMVEKIAPASMAHIHKAPAGANGPVAVPLTTPDAAGKSSGCATVGAPVVADILANPGGYYVNVHNADHPGGAVRGQLSK
jgi:hypothetical protein